MPLPLVLGVELHRRCLKTLCRMRPIGQAGPKGPGCLEVFTFAEWSICTNHEDHRYKQHFAPLPIHKLRQDYARYSTRA